MTPEEVSADAVLVDTGTGYSVRVVAAAALVMFFVFASFLTAQNLTVQAIGFGMAVGVLLDAFVVRLTLVPAFMTLIGGRFWRTLPRRRTAAP